MTSNPEGIINIGVGGKLVRVIAWLSEYLNNGATALDLIDPETTNPVARISLNAHGYSGGLRRNEFYVQHWGANKPIVAQLIAQRIIVPVPDERPAWINHRRVVAYRYTGQEYRTDECCAG